MPKRCFSIATLLWLTLCVAAFFGGRLSRESEIESARRLAEQHKAMSLAIKDALESTELELAYQRHVASKQKRWLDADMAAGTTCDLVHNGDSATVISHWPRADFLRFLFDFARSSRIFLGNDQLHLYALGRDDAGRRAVSHAAGAWTQQRCRATRSKPHV